MATLAAHPDPRPQAPEIRILQSAVSAPPRHVPAPPVPAQPDDLRELMRAVTETTERLHATHTALQDQVARLQSELAEANAALRRSQALAALGEMAAGIAHEIRNPLGSIQLYVQMLGEDLADRPPQAELCSKIDRAVVGLDAIVRDVLAFARNTTIDPHPVRVDDLLARAISNCQSLLNRHIKLTVNKSGLSLSVDSGLIVQAIGNIVRNSVEAMQEAGSAERELRMSASQRRLRCPNGKHEPRIILAVQDTGPGIPSAVMDRLFNPFFTTRQTGTGLGLAIVHRIVDAHGGHILVHNVPEGGAKIELCLPLKPIQPKAAARAHLNELNGAAVT